MFGTMAHVMFGTMAHLVFGTMAHLVFGTMFSKEKEKEVPCNLHRLVDEVVEAGLGTIISAPDFNWTRQVTQRSELSERARAT